MRTIGTLPGEREARRFEDYLLTLNIKSMVEAEDGEWIVWILDEDELETARGEFAAYREDTDAKKYRAVGDAAGRIRKEAERQEAIARKQVVNVRDRWRRSAIQQAPLTMVLIFISIGVSLISNRGKKVEPIVRMLGFAAFQSGPSYGGWDLETGARGDEQIRAGQVWRLVTPIFIHLSILHLVFNMYWTFQLGRMIESRRGAIRLGLMVLLIAVLSNCAQFGMTGRPRFGGMSGVVYGLFGYIWMKTRFDAGSGMFLPQSTIFLMLAWFFLCWTDIGFFKNIANWAHAGGLIVGVVMGYARVAIRDLKRR